MHQGCHSCNTLVSTISVGMGIFRLFMTGKFNTYLLWPLGKSVKINKCRAYVYLEHKSNLIKQYKLFQVILFWKLRLDPLCKIFAGPREWSLRSKILFSQMYFQLFCTLWIPFCTIFLWPQWSLLSIRQLIDMQASRSYEYSNKRRLKLRFQLFSPHYRNSFYRYLNILMTARAKAGNQ